MFLYHHYGSRIVDNCMFFDDRQKLIHLNILKNNIHMYFSLMQNKVINFLPMPEIKPEMLSDAEVSFFRNYLTN